MAGREAANPDRSADRLAGAALIAAAAGTVFVMGHHPTHLEDALAGRLVHAILILFTGAAAFGFAHFAIRRGLGRPAVLAGLVAYGVALFGHIGAATINGFAVPALAARPGAAGHGELFHFAWELNQALASLGVVATGLAFVLWSIDLLLGGVRSARLTAVAGLVAGGLPAALLLSGTVGMNLTGAAFAYAVQAAWTALVGFQLMRGSIERWRAA